MSRGARLTGTRLVAVAVSVATATLAGPSRAEEEVSVWRSFRPLVGEWRGEGSGFGATSDVTHEWGFAVGGRFLELRTRSVPRSADDPGEVHEDVGFLSHDADRDGFVFCQFLSEGS